MQTVGLGEGGGSGKRRKYRVLKLKQEWTTSVLVGDNGELQRCTFKAVALLPPEGTLEVHLAAVGNAERELQAAARALSPQAPGSGTCPRSLLGGKRRDKIAWLLGRLLRVVNALIGNPPEGACVPTGSSP